MSPNILQGIQLIASYGHPDLTGFSFVWLYGVNKNVIGDFSPSWNLERVDKKMLLPFTLSVSDQFMESLIKHCPNLLARDFFQMYEIGPSNSYSY